MFNQQPQKKQFVPNIWIIFEIGGYDCVGRTIETHNKQLVSYVNDIGEQQIVDFQNITNPRRLKLPNEKPLNQIMNNRTTSSQHSGIDRFLNDLNKIEPDNNITKDLLPNPYTDMLKNGHIIYELKLDNKPKTMNALLMVMYKN